MLVKVYLTKELGFDTLRSLLDSGKKLTPFSSNSDNWVVVNLTSEEHSEVCGKGFLVTKERTYDLEGESLSL